MVRTLPFTKHFRSRCQVTQSSNAFVLKLRGVLCTIDQQSHGCAKMSLFVPACYAADSCAKLRTTSSNVQRSWPKEGNVTVSLAHV